MTHKITRRDAVSTLAAGVASGALLGRSAAQTKPDSPNSLQVELTPKFDLSPHLYMQFMEPLGTTDSSVEAAWDHSRDNWRKDVVEATCDLRPSMIRWGGIFTDFYRWKEGVGPRDQRPPMQNLMWGGMESNQVGTAEFVDFCRRTEADPLMCVNFESDGRPQYMTAKGRSRTGDAQEAADWVSYCNDPDNALRKKHGHAEPLTIPYWQLGNETSYDRHGFDLPKTIKKTIEFSRAMRAVDPNVQIIGWGDSGWAKDMLEQAGEHVDMLAFHHMFDPDSRDHPVLRGERYLRDIDATWHQLMNAWEIHDRKIKRIRDSLGGKEFPLAMTECHFSIPGRDRCDVMSTWATGVSYGRILNTHQRHGDLLKIATAADFCGTRWQVNAVMIPVPHGKSYLMPVARVMKLYRDHAGIEAVDVVSSPDNLDVVASRTGQKLFLHIVNTSRTRSVAANFSVPATALSSAVAFQIADDPMMEVSELNSSKVMQIKRSDLSMDGKWTFPPASVTAVEVDLVT